MNPIQVETLKGFTGKLYYDENVESPKDSMDQLGTLVTWHRRYCFDQDGEKAFGRPSAFLEQAKVEGWVFLPVAMIDHSGVSLYEGTGAHRCDPGGWDSGQVGFIYCSKERFTQMIDTKVHRWRKRAEEILRQELRTWDDFVSGQVFGYVVETPDGEHVDSCWGFYGLEYVREEMLQALKSAVAEEEKAEKMVGESFAL